MKCRLILLLAVFPFSLYSQTPQMDKGSTVKKMCGRVTLFETWGTPPPSSWKRAPIKKADVLLYRRIAKRKCCAPDELIAETPTDSAGVFEFKDAAPGQYWVVVVLGKKNHKLAVNLTPSGEMGDEDCSLLDYEVVNGRELRLTKMYRVH